MILVVLRASFLFFVKNKNSNMYVRALLNRNFEALIHCVAFDKSIVRDIRAHGWSNYSNNYRA